MCSSSGFDCHWCVVTHKCGILSKSCGAEPWMVRSYLAIRYVYIYFNAPHFLFHHVSILILLLQTPTNLYILINLSSMVLFRLLSSGLLLLYTSIVFRALRMK